MPKVNRTTNDELAVKPRDLANLRKSGLSDETIIRNGLRTVTDSNELAGILNRDASSNACLGGLVIPYRNKNAEVNGFARVRPHYPRTAGGKPIKYEQPVGEPNRAYFPAECVDDLRDGAGDVHVTEGEKKAMSLAQAGYAATGVCGIFGWKVKGEQVLIGSLAEMNWQGRNVYVAFDFDEKESTRRQTRAAANQLARLLMAAGAAEVLFVDIPPGPDGAKQGVDDFIVANGAEAYQELIEKARPATGLVNSVNSPRQPDGGERLIQLIPPTLGDAAYQGIVGDFLRAVSPHTEATDAAVLAHLLPAVAMVAGPGPHVFAGNKQYPRINVAVVGKTNKGRKGTSLVPVDMAFEHALPDLWKKQRCSGLATGEGLVAKVSDIRKRDEEGEEEIVPVEKRVLVVEEELSKVLAQIKRDQNILSQVVREAFDGGNLGVLTRGNPLHAAGAHICIIGHVTPEELIARLMEVEMANGFGNRFLWFYVESDKVLAKTVPFPDSVFEIIAPRLRRLYEEKSRAVPFGVEAMKKWADDVYPRLREDQPGLAGAMTARGSTMVLRIALIYCLLEKDPERRKSIRLEHLDAALAVWAYCEESAHMLFRSKTGTPFGDKLLQLLASGPMKRNEFTNHTTKTSDEIGAALAKLESAGLIRKSMGSHKGGGRPPEIWELAGPSNRAGN